MIKSIHKTISTQFFLNKVKPMLRKTMKLVEHKIKKPGYRDVFILFAGMKLHRSWSHNILCGLNTKNIVFFLTLWHVLINVSTKSIQALYELNQSRSWLKLCIAFIKERYDTISVAFNISNRFITYVKVAYKTSVRLVICPKKWQL